MKRLELDVLSEATNAAIVRMPGRNFPGMVIQGDTLNILTRNAKRGHMKEVAKQLDGLLSHYIAVLKSEGIGLPFPNSQET